MWLGDQAKPAPKKKAASKKKAPAKVEREREKSRGGGKIWLCERKTSSLHHRTLVRAYTLSAHKLSFLVSFSDARPEAKEGRVLVGGII